jgi:hypothetical protein
MSLNNPALGEGYVPAYQISPIPYVTSSLVALGSTQAYSFPCVTKSIFIQNQTSSTAIAVAFTANGLKAQNSNYFILSGGQSFSQDLRTSQLFISGAVGAASYQLVAGLTNIPTKNFMIVTGSNGYVGVG